MKFKLSLTGYFYKNDKHKKYESLGFNFKPYENSGVMQSIDKYFAGSYTKNDDVKPEIEINTIEELIKFTEKYGECVVCGDELEIYNDYRE